ncbi:hypothetical protein DU53_07880 [Kosmotoga sp. DU53]|nr:hypothetical protein DU53_07880 [Kosmotoga sp. DU53]
MKSGFGGRKSKNYRLTTINWQPATKAFFYPKESALLMGSGLSLKKRAVPCVQKRQVHSVGDKPTKAKARTL